MSVDLVTDSSLFRLESFSLGWFTISLNYLFGNAPTLNPNRFLESTAKQVLCPMAQQKTNLVQEESLHHAPFWGCTSRYWYSTNMLTSTSGRSGTPMNCYKVELWRNCECPWISSSFSPFSQSEIRIIGLLVQALFPGDEYFRELHLSAADVDMVSMFWLFQ